MLRLTISILLISGICYAETSQNIIDNVSGETGVSLMNEEIRRLGEDIDYNDSKITTLADSGFGIVLSGDAEVATDVIPSRYYLPISGHFTKIIAYAKTAPTGDDLIIDVNLNGSTILNSGKVTIGAGSNSATITSFANSAFNPDDYLTIDVDQIGSSTEGADIVLSFYVEKAT